ncbi:ROK family protein [Microbispora hainanensis]|uniref:ROK family protein n=1 Tax=Microbispora hainanensis TaxID=568844 RepID=A0A544YWP5_9ACTN|nr:ROK family protein [Microbispora hainanensis]
MGKGVSHFVLVSVGTGAGAGVMIDVHARAGRRDPRGAGGRAVHGARPRFRTCRRGGTRLTRGYTRLWTEW